MEDERLSSDPPTGLEEPMWQLALASALPERPGKPDCVYYLRTGSCGYADKCRFNHPRDLTVAWTGTELPEQMGQQICQYFVRTGTCKFGAACKYHHPNWSGPPNPIQLNYRGFPLRPGEKECSYYVKTGNCKFGVTCKFHHPQPAPPTPAYYPPPAAASHPYAAVASWSVARSPAYLSGSYAYGPIAIPPGVVPVPSWSAYPPHVSPVVSSGTVQTLQAGSVYGSAPFQLSASAQAYPSAYMAASSSSAHSSGGQKEHGFPDRPGQPECQFYLRTGDCKYGSSCRYHHPPEWNVQKINCTLSPLGLPLRPGAPTCTFYTQNGVCKFGPTCKFDHPMGALSYSPSASSLADMPVAPYPIGFSMAAMAPSSSSDLRHEYFGGATGEVVPVRVPLSSNRSSGSIGSMFSTGYPVSEARAPNQSSISSSSTRGVEI